MPDNTNPNTETGAIDTNAPRVMEGINTTQPTDAQSDQYTQTASDIDADRPNPTPSGPPGTPPPSGTPPTVNTQGVPISPNAKQNLANMPQAQPSKFNTPPAVTQKASWVHDIAETLSGGPRYQYSIDPNTGEMKKTPVPVSAKHLGLAIALEALGGGFTSLAEGKGAGNKGKGYAAAFQQGKAQVQQQDQLAQQQATQEYARKASIAQTNMRMAMNERALSNADISLHQRDVDQMKPVYDEAVKENAIDRDGISEAEAHRLLQPGPDGQSALHVTKDMLIPTRVVPAPPDANGNQPKGPNGEPRYEKEYALLKPLSEINLPADTLKTLQDNKVPGYVDRDGNPIDLPKSYRPRLQLVINGLEQARAIQTNHAVIKGLSQRQFNPLHPDGGTAGTTAPQLTSPDLQNDTFDKLATQAANDNNVDPALVKAIIKTESNGDPKAVSKKGAQGLMQLMPETAKGLGLSGNDVLDPEKNINAGTKYFKQLLDQYNGNVSEALSAYNAGPKNVPAGKGVPNIQETQAYVNNIAKMTGFDKAQAKTEAANKPAMSEEQINELTKDLTPKQRDLLNQWQLFYDGGPDKASTMDKSTIPGPNGESPRNDPTDVGVVKSKLNEVYPMDKYHADIDQYKQDLAVDTAGRKAQEKQDVEDAYAAKSSSYLKGGEHFTDIPNLLNMSPSQAKAALEGQGIPVPPEIGALQTVAQYGGPIEKFFPAKTYKGTSTISAQDAASYIRAYLNPSYNENMYAQAHRVAEDYGNQSIGKPGGQLNSIDTASQHIALLGQVADGLRNGTFPTINAAANWLATKEGKPEPQAFSAVAQIVGAEVQKVTGGGSPLEAELKKFAETLNKDQSPEQIQAIVDDYINLMQGRMDSLNNNYKEYFNKDIRRMSTNTAMIFGKRGYYVPGYGTPFNGSDGKLYFSLTGNQKDAKPLGI